jgi:aminomethyltransferase
MASLIAGGPVPVATPFHPRTASLCTSMFWKEWAGYYAVRSYDTCHEREYFALRHAAGLIDVSPLFKYEVRGKEAGEFLSYVTVKDVAAMKAGRVSYLCWCDDAGKLLDDGTVSRLDEFHFRVTAAEQALVWLRDRSIGFDVTIEDSTDKIGALSLQGPNSRAILGELTDGAVDGLRYFRVMQAKIDGKPVHVSRTGYTGDLGYEIWVAAEDALDVWDRIMAAGKTYRIQPAGLDAMDVTRVEAGFIMNGVDYFSAHHCLVESRKSTPHEVGLGWTVQLDRERFVGQAAIREELARGSRWALVGLRYDWDEYEKLFEEFGLPPQAPHGAWRDPVPVFMPGGRQVGQATSGSWSPLLKANLALASVESAYGKIGTDLQIEVTAEYQRRRVRATVAKMPFLDLPRKRAKS